MLLRSQFLFCFNVTTYVFLITCYRLKQMSLELIIKALLTSNCMRILLLLTMFLHNSHQIIGRQTNQPSKSKRCKYIYFDFLFILKLHSIISHLDAQKKNICIIFPQLCVVIYSTAWNFKSKLNVK